MRATINRPSSGRQGDEPSVTGLSGVPRSVVRTLLSLTLAMSAAAILLLASGIGGRISQIPVTSLATGLFILALLAATFSQYESFGLREFRIGAWMLLFASFSFGFASTTLVEVQAFGTRQQLDRQLVPLALLVVCAGLLAFALGYRLGPISLAHKIVEWVTGFGGASRRGMPRSSLAMVLTYAVGLGAAGLLIYFQGTFAYAGGSAVDTVTRSAATTQPLLILGAMRAMAIFGLGCRLRMGLSRGTERELLVLLASAEFVLALLSGLKESFVTLALALILPHVLTGRRLPLFRLVAALLVFIFIVTPFVNAYRAEIRSGGDRLDVTQSFKAGSESLVSGDFLHADPSEQDGSLLDRVREVDNLVIVIQRTPSEFPYHPLTDIALAPATALIPRAVWPSKPLRLSGFEFYRDYYGGVGQSSSAITIPGSLYMHGGILVVLGGMALLGVGVAALDRTIFRAGPIRGGILLLITFNVLVKQEIDVPTLLANIPTYLMTYYIAVTLIGRSDREVPTLTRAPARSGA